MLDDFGIAVTGQVGGASKQHDAPSVGKHSTTLASPRKSHPGFSLRIGRMIRFLDGQPTGLKGRDGLGGTAYLGCGGRKIAAFRPFCPRCTGPARSAALGWMKMAVRPRSKRQTLFVLPTAMIPHPRGSERGIPPSRGLTLTRPATSATRSTACWRCSHSVASEVASTTSASPNSSP